MSKVIKQDFKRFTTVSNTIVRDDKLSWKARGIFLYIYSQSDDWEFYETEIMNHATDGRASLRAGLKELEEHGYLKRTRKRNDKGVLEGSDWLISNEPMSDNQTLDKPMFDYPKLDKPTLDNRTLSNTNKSNTNKSNKEEEEEERKPDELDLVFAKQPITKLDTELGSVFDHWQECINVNLNPTVQTTILNLWNKLVNQTTKKDAAELFNWAIDQAVMANAINARYVTSVIGKSIVAKNIKTVDEANKKADEFRNKKQQQSKPYNNKPRIVETKPTYEQPKQETEVTDEQVARTKQMIEQMKLNRNVK